MSHASRGFSGAARRCRRDRRRRFRSLRAVSAQWEIVTHVHSRRTYNSAMKNRPTYAIASVDHALQLATILQVEGPLTVSEAAERLGVARSTAHRLLSMLCYRDFAVQDGDRRYVAGPVVALATRSHSRAALLRDVAMPHLTTLSRARRRVDEPDGPVRRPRPLRRLDRGDAGAPRGQPRGRGLPGTPQLRRGAVAGRRPRRAVRGDLQRRALGRPRRPAARPHGTAPGDAPGAQARVRPQQRADRDRRHRRRPGGALGRRPAEAAVSISLPTARYTRAVLPKLVAALAATTADIERDLAARSRQGSIAESP